jgi:hypothetical protein
MVRRVPCSDPTNALSWHPKQYILAFAGDDRSMVAEHDKGCIRILNCPPTSH